MNLKSKDTLSIIQLFAKFGQILSQAFMIVGIVAGSLCLLGIFSLAIGIDKSFSVFGVEIHGLIEQEAGMTTAGMFISLITGAIMCAAGAVNSGFAKKYFKNELRAGTPFTFDGAKEMLRLGIIIMAVTMGAAIVSGIIEGIVKAAADIDSRPDTVDIGGSFSAGLMLFMMSFVCKHGAEVSGKEVKA